MEIVVDQETESPANLESAIEQAQSWQDDFVEDFDESHHFDEVIELNIFQEDVEKLENLIEIFRDISDEELWKRIDELKDNVPSYMNSLKGVVQAPPHEDIDAFDHTFNTFYYLKTDGQTTDEKLILRLTLLLHDIAKMNGADDREHPRRSGEMARQILENSNLPDNIKKEITKQVTLHDFLGDISRKDGYGMFRPQQMIEFFDNEDQVRFHFQIVQADVASIPGLRTYLPNIERTYGRLLNNLDRINWKFIPPEEGGEVLEEDIVHSIVHEVIPEERVFNDTDINDDCLERRERFDNLPEEKKTALEKFLIRASKEFDDNVLKALQATGREIDETYIDEIEKKYDEKCPELRIACNVFRATYGMWEVNRIIRNVDNWEDLDTYIEHWLTEIKDAGQNLSQYETIATHCTNYEAKQQIEESGELLKSVGASHYEGDGVYVGLMGSYRGWADYMYSFNIKMEDVLPIIVSFNYPKMMANALCSLLDIHLGEKQVAVPKGNIEWLHEDMDIESSPMQLKLLSKFLGKITRLEDYSGLPCWMVSTDQPPIVWGMIARALRIRNVIPAYELPYLFEDEEIDKELPLGPKTAIRIKGITKRELEEFI